MTPVDNNFAKTNNISRNLNFVIFILKVMGNEKKGGWGKKWYQSIDLGSVSGHY